MQKETLIVSKVNATLKTSLALKAGKFFQCMVKRRDTRSYSSAGISDPEENKKPMGVSMSYSH